MNGEGAMEQKNPPLGPFGDDQGRCRALVSAEKTPGRDARFRPSPHALLQCEDAGGGQFTSRIGTSSARANTFWEMLPMKNSLIPDSPRRPITTRS